MPDDGSPDPDTVRVALVADTHGYLDPRVAEIVAGCDRAVHAGDIGGDAVLAALDRPAAAVIAVSGNNDTPAHWPPAERTRLADLPSDAHVPLPGGELVVTHGHRFAARHRHDRLRRTYPSATAIVCGHSHRAAVDCSLVPWILNPGAAGRSRAYGGPGCLVLYATQERWEIEDHRFAPLRRRR